jgi:plastocyanin
MTTLIHKIKMAALICGISTLALSVFADDTANTSAGSKVNKIEIKDFMFNPQKITVKSGDKITWVNRDEEPHTVVSVGKKFPKSSGLDTDQEYSIIAGAPGTYEYFCSVHPKMTGTIVVEK